MGINIFLNDIILIPISYFMAAYGTKVNNKEVLVMVSNDSW